MATTAQQHPDPKTANPAPASAPPPKPPKQTIVPGDGPYDDLISGAGMVPGDHGWLGLDATGKGTTLTKEPPEPGNPACAVMAQVTPTSRAALMSITGADLTDHLQPNPDFRPTGLPSDTPTPVQAGSWTTNEPKADAKHK